MSDELSFREYQQLAIRTNRSKGDDLKSVMIPLLGLAGEAGSLLTEYKKWLREGEKYRPFTDQVSEELGDILWYLANIAEQEGLDLHEIAQENLAKLEDRWAHTTQPNGSLFVAERYDTEFPESERLPLQIRAVFREVFDNGVKKLEITANDLLFGNPLTDNSHWDDGYRFHDVFHIAFAIVLGWSPQVRKQLKVKRRSVPQVDEVEDGARAAITEEAVSAFVFGMAGDYSYFDGASSVDFGILRTVKLMTRPFEVRDKSLRDWEEAILRGYEVWNQMVKNGGGILIGDARTRAITYEPIPAILSTRSS